MPVSLEKNNHSHQIVFPKEAVVDVDATKEISAPEINDYEVVGESKKSVTGTGEAINVEFTYKKAEEKSTETVTTETEQAPTETPDDDKNPIGAIIAIVIFVVVLGAIAVGAFLLIRSDKNTTKDSRTVRKNVDGKGKKK